MTQEFNVLRCYKCKYFQVHPVKKSKKWECKMCGVKQSLQKIFDTGSAKECRLIVQNLNSIMIRSKDITYECKNFQTCTNLKLLSDEDNSSKWQEYLMHEVDTTETMVNEEQKLVVESDNSNLASDKDNFSKWEEYLKHEVDTNESIINEKQKNVDPNLLPDKENCSKWQEYLTHEVDSNESIVNETQKNVDPNLLPDKEISSQWQEYFAHEVNLNNSIVNKKQKKADEKLVNYSTKFNLTDEIDMKDSFEINKVDAVDKKDDQIFEEDFDIDTYLNVFRN